MKHIILFTIVAVLGLTGCSKSEEDSNATSNDSGSVLTAPVDYIGTLGKAHKSATMTTSTVSMKNAILSFEAAEGRAPKDLNELVTKEYLPRLPEPPVGMKFNYDAKTATVTVVPE